MESKTAQISGPLSRDRDAICSLIAERVGLDQVPEKFKVITDTSDFFRVEYNDVVILGETPFWVKRYEKEGRFGRLLHPSNWCSTKSSRQRLAVSSLNVSAALKRKRASSIWWRNTKTSCMDTG